MFCVTLYEIQEVVREFIPCHFGRKVEYVSNDTFIIKSGIWHSIPGIGSGGFRSSSFIHIQFYLEKFWQFSPPGLLLQLLSLLLLLLPLKVAGKRRDYDISDGWFDRTTPFTNTLHRDKLITNFSYSPYLD